MAMTKKEKAASTTPIVDANAMYGAYVKKSAPMICVTIARGIESENTRLREALRLAADEPNIDRARAIADAALKKGGE